MDKTTCITKSKKLNIQIVYPITVMTLAVAPLLIVNYFPDYLDAKYK